MTSGFTRGPWRVGADLTGIVVDWRDQDGNCDRECATKNGWAKTVAKVTHASFADVAEHVANAHLIAAAPELYEVVECGFALLSKGLDPRLDNLIDKAKSAIAKARGEPIRMTIPSGEE